MTTSENPFLHPFKTKLDAIPFDHIKAEHFIPAIKEGIRIAKDNIEKIKTESSPANFKNTFVALETSSELLDVAVGTYYVLFSAESPKEIQAIAGEVAQLHSDFSSDISLDEKLFAKVKEAYDSLNFNSLSPEEASLAEKTYKSFTRNGALLSAEDKKTLREIDQKLAALSPKFSENLLSATNAYVLYVDDESKLSGLPEDAKATAKELATKKSKPNSWAFSLQAPSMLAAVTYLDNSELREQIWRAYGQRCFGGEFDNSNIVKQIVELKHQRAQLLGFKTHADYVLAERMAQSRTKVDEFLNKLLKHSKPAAERDLKALEQEKKASGQTDPLKPWDIRYFEEKLKKKLYDIDQEELRPYFQLEKVYNGAFDLVERLYQIEFKKIEGIPTYHQEVVVFEVLDKNTKEHIGLFYMDFFPRDTKRGGAWMTDFMSQGLYKNSVKRPHIGIVMNFARPANNKPSLLTFDEVSTFFHEFGHALHGLLSKCTYRSVAGTNVYWDFVELPSQFMENWVLEKDVLDLFARHYQTNQPLPLELFNKLKASSKFMSGYNSLRQVSFSLLDMKWHTTDPLAVTDVKSFEEVALKPTQILAPQPDVNMSVSFSHIFAGGYSAGYYSYKWAEVLDADAFEYFKEKGLFDAQVAKKFKEHILEKGGTQHPMDLYLAFRGREPDPDSLLRRDGLI